MYKLEEKIDEKYVKDIFLTENWHNEILKYLGCQDFPYEFEFNKKVKVEAIKDSVYIFKSNGKNGKKCKKIALSTLVLKRFFAREVPDTNLGLSFKEYLPIENTSLIISSIRNPTMIYVLTFKNTVNEINISGKKTLYLDFILNYPFDTKTYMSISDCTKNKMTWKFLDSKDTSCMTNYELTMQDAYIHKRYVMKMCEKLSR